MHRRQETVDIGRARGELVESKVIVARDEGWRQEGDREQDGPIHSPGRWIHDRRRPEATSAAHERRGALRPKRSAAT
jgi:hypothetical protein